MINSMHVVQKSCERQLSNKKFKTNLLVSIDYLLSMPDASVRWHSSPKRNAEIIFFKTKSVVIHSLLYVVCDGLMCVSV